MDSSKEKNDHLIKIDEYIKSIKYGMVTVIIQDGKVIQIEKTEKERLK